MTRASIIITCYNLGEFLQEALDSALSQTYHDTEVVLVDDGSTDKATLALLDRLAHPRLRVLRGTNQGVARARNYGISQASGEYILPLDADDRILPQYLAHAIAILDQRPEVGFVGCHYRTFGLRHTEYRPAAYRLPDMLVENAAPIASVFRRGCWEENGGYCAELNSIEDWDFWISILEHGHLGVVLPQIFFEYRIRPNSNLSHIRDPATYRTRMQLLYQRHRELYRRHHEEVLLLKDVQFAQIHSHVAWLEQQMHNWQQVAEEREALLAAQGRPTARSMQRRIWWQAQTDRLQRATAGQPSLGGKIRAVLSGCWRVVRRRIAG
ncbi:MAG TPA: glycosyltransferase family A protein [Roseiflexaceae bacterium]|nr:glycosyltransferase family A protein [Roseiflexaceae bacterium]